MIKNSMISVIESVIVSIMESYTIPTTKDIIVHLVIENPKTIPKLERRSEFVPKDWFCPHCRHLLVDRKDGEKNWSLYCYSCGKQFIIEEIIK